MGPSLLGIHSCVVYRRYLPVLCFWNWPTQVGALRSRYRFQKEETYGFS
jgi:hypothetical protein